MSSFKILQRKQAEIKRKLSEYTELDPSLVENVMQYVKHLVKPELNGITQTVFTTQMMNHFSFTNQHMINQMYEALLRRKHKDQTREPPGVGTSCVLMEDYCFLMCVFMSKNLAVQIDWVFSVYDTNGDKELSRVELYLLLKPCVLHSEDMEIDEAVKELVEIVISVFDMDKSGSIDLDEFRSLVKRDLLYIDLLGQCLPGERELKIFREQFENKTALEVSEFFRREKQKTSITVDVEITDSLYPISLDMP